MNRLYDHQEHCPISPTQTAGSLSSRDNSEKVQGSGVQSLASTLKYVPQASVLTAAHKNTIGAVCLLGTNPGCFWHMVSRDSSVEMHSIMK